MGVEVDVCGCLGEDVCIGSNEGIEVKVGVGVTGSAMANLTVCGTAAFPPSYTA